MKQGKKSFRHESLQDVKSIRQILESVTNGIAKGKVVFSDEDDEIVMQPEGLLQLRLKASQEENRRQINIRINWQVEDKPLRKKSLSVS